MFGFMSVAGITKKMTKMQQELDKRATRMGKKAAKLEAKRIAALEEQEAAEEWKAVLPKPPVKKKVESK